MTADAPPEDLDSAVADLYRAPLPEFVPRRDALAKELRAAGRPDDAKAVKGLRKPTRMAWALNAAVLNDRDTVEHVTAAVVDMLKAQSGRGDVRQASDELRAAARDLSSAAARAARDAGQTIDQGVLLPAVLAVIGDPEAFEALRAGRLADVPAAGGLDLLTGAPPEVASDWTPKAVEPPPADPQAVTTARQALEQAEADAEAAREQAAAADEAAAAADADLEAAEERLRLAEEEARALRARLRQIQQEAKAAQRQLRDAETTAARARAHLDQLTQ